MNLRIAMSLIAAAAVLCAGPATAQFYKGKRITILINYGAGGPTDIEARLIARYFAKHIPGNPRVIAKNRPGAGGIVGSNFMGEVAKPDGLTVAIFTPPTISQVLNDPGLRVNFAKDFTWLAGIGQPQVCYMRKDVSPGINGPMDITRAKGFKAAGMRTTSSHDIRLRLSLNMLGIDYKYVTGFRGLAKVAASVLQNETQYSCGSVPNFRGNVEPTLIKTGQAVPMWYYAPVDSSGNEQKFADLAGIPTFLEVYAKIKGGKPSGIAYDAYQMVNNLSTYMLRGSFVPRKTPKQAVDALKAAWQALPGDSAFVAAYMKAFRAPPKIIQAAAAKAQIARVLTIDPKIADFLRKLAGTKK
jgi:tripartite-type tricarboxylate transporter receptor subunit TctC